MSQQSQAVTTIVVPLDGSDLAEAAIPVAAAIALPGGARINLVTVALTYELPVDAQMDTITRRGLNRAQAELESKFPGVTQTVLAGDPAQEISKHAGAIDADLIVMATHGRSGLRKLLLGSVADKLITMSSVPVLLVKGDGGEPVPPLGTPASFKRIVLPLDGSEPSAAAAPIAMELARLLNAETALVYVDEGGGAGKPESQAREIASRFDAAGLAARVQVIDGDPGHSIAEFTSEVEGSLVVMSSLSATGIAKGTHRGSVTDYVIKNARAPVVVVPPRGYLGPVIN